MYDKGKIVTGLVIAIVVLTFPIWWNHLSAAPVPDPKLAPAAVAAKTCVLPLAEMKTGHMQILDDWRKTVVRDQQRTYKAANGQTYTMSLQNTCMTCHTSKKEFCDQCHNYTNVAPLCWDCHIAPPEGK